MPLPLIELFYSSLQTGMRGAFGKPQGTVARVHIGQPIMSVRSSDRFKAAVIEALRRAKFKFPGRQKIYVSKKWGFTKYDREQYEKLKSEGRLAPDGCNVQYRPEHGPFGQLEEGSGRSCCFLSIVLNI
ncbi:unnamed protein product [Callosobruchus maculatus]|uniref:Uncharacterized protein n=1 Tax=Callosobruchus maculatus TaxID=64391 RepID=A0A653DAZ7_CALMS|nr:unnamed protein product [Callosobruchus maculatus]